MIRNVRAEDAAAIAEIYNYFVLNTTVSFETDKVSPSEMARRIRDISAVFPYYVHEGNGEINGYGYAHLWKERQAYCRTLETTVYIAPSCHGRGIGREIMRRLIEECRHRGFLVLVACITADNIPSRRFHQSLGFRQVSLFEGVGFKFGRRLDVADYQLTL